ncbi:hypothetical protein ACSSS7_007365 [Eimeria intestinalis]
MCFGDAEPRHFPGGRGALQLAAPPPAPPRREWSYRPTLSSRWRTRACRPVGQAMQAPGVRRGQVRRWQRQRRRGLALPKGLQRRRWRDEICSLWVNGIRSLQRLRSHLLLENRGYNRGTSGATAVDRARPVRWTPTRNSRNDACAGLNRASRRSCPAAKAGGDRSPAPTTRDLLVRGDLDQPSPPTTKPQRHHLPAGNQLGETKTPPSVACPLVEDGAGGDGWRVAAALAGREGAEEAAGTEGRAEGRGVMSLSLSPSPVSPGLEALARPSQARVPRECPPPAPDPVAPHSCDPGSKERHDEADRVEFKRDLGLIFWIVLPELHPLRPRRQSCDEEPGVLGQKVLPGWGSPTRPARALPSKGSALCLFLTFALAPTEGGTAPFGDCGRGCMGDCGAAPVAGAGAAASLPSECGCGRGCWLASTPEPSEFRPLPPTRLRQDKERKRGGGLRRGPRLSQTGHQGGPCYGWAGFGSWSHLHSGFEAVRPLAGEREHDLLACHQEVWAEAGHRMRGGAVVEGGCGQDNVPVALEVVYPDLKEQRAGHASAANPVIGNSGSGIVRGDQLDPSRVVADDGQNVVVLLLDDREQAEHADPDVCVVVGGRETGGGRIGVRCEAGVLEAVAKHAAALEGFCCPSPRKRRIEGCTTIAEKTGAAERSARKGSRSVGNNSLAIVVALQKDRAEAVARPATVQIEKPLVIGAGENGFATTRLAESAPSGFGFWCPVETARKGGGLEKRRGDNSEDGLDLRWPRLDAASRIDVAQVGLTKGGKELAEVGAVVGPGFAAQHRRQAPEALCTIKSGAVQQPELVGNGAAQRLTHCGGEAARRDRGGRGVGGVQAGCQQAVAGSGALPSLKRQLFGGKQEGKDATADLLLCGGVLRRWRRGGHGNHAEGLDVGRVNDLRLDQGSSGSQVQGRVGRVGYLDKACRHLCRGAETKVFPFGGGEARQRGRRGPWLRRAGRDPGAGVRRDQDVGGHRASGNPARVVTDEGVHLVAVALEDEGSGAVLRRPRGVSAGARSRVRESSAARAWWQVEGLSVSGSDARAIGEVLGLPGRWGGGRGSPARQDRAEETAMEQSGTRQHTCGGHERGCRRRNRDLTREAVDGVVGARAVEGRRREVADRLPLLLKVVDSGRPRGSKGHWQISREVYERWGRRRGCWVALRRWAGGSSRTGLAAAGEWGAAQNSSSTVSVLASCGRCSPSPGYVRAKVSKVMARWATFWGSLRRSAGSPGYGCGMGLGGPHVQVRNLYVRAAGDGGDSLVETVCAAPPSGWAAWMQLWHGDVECVQGAAEGLKGKLDGLKEGA